MYNAYLTLVTQKTCMKNPPLTLTRLRDDPEPPFDDPETPFDDPETPFDDPVFVWFTTAGSTCFPTCPRNTVHSKRIIDEEQCRLNYEYFWSISNE